MLDTNVFNRIQGGKVLLSTFNNYELFITHVQVDELDRTNDKSLAEEFLKIVSVLQPNITPTSAGVWDDSRWDQSKWSSGDNYNKMLDRLKVLDAEKKKKSNQKLNQSRDVRIAMTAVDNDCTLISTDCNLLILTLEFNGAAIHLDDFLQIIGA